MNTTTYFRIAPALIALTFFGLAGCAPAPENVVTPEPVVVESKPDMAAVKAEIQAIENLAGPRLIMPVIYLPYLLSIVTMQ